jgi:hypothetical protein
LLPQHRTVPSLVTAQVYAVPPATAVALSETVGGEAPLEAVGASLPYEFHSKNPTRCGRGERPLDGHGQVDR